MTHEEAFLADIREHPDDDTPRLIFADWLEENGDPERAEFIRVRIASVRDPEPRGKGYLARAGKLIEKNWGRWVVPLCRLVGPERYERWLTPVLSVARTTAAGQFPRGFVSALSMGTERFLEHGEATNRLTPLTDLCLHGAGGRGKDLAACPSLRGMRSLGFLDFYTAPVDGSDVAALADSEHLDRLTVLRLAHHNLGDQGVKALVTARWLPQLTELDLTENGLSRDSLFTLAQCTRLASLRHLRISNNAVIGDLAARILTAAPWLRQLDTLVMRKMEVSSAARETLLRLAPDLRVILD
jgi:uncharacterized protein (TIGR02996 family)